MGRQRSTALSTRRRPARYLVPLVVAVVVLGATEPTGVGPQGVEVLARSEPSAFFPIGWYDTLAAPHRLTLIAGEGMNAVLPYDAPHADPGRYLEAADRAHLKVMLEIPRALVRARDIESIREFVRRYREHPALYGWYLADEPTTSTSVVPLTPRDAERLYAAVKRADDDHPVAIAFSSGEAIGRFLRAMDVPMYDDYPARVGDAPFERLAGWSDRIFDRGSLAASEGGFIPILQAVGGPDVRSFGLRLPTAEEQRYMVYASLQAGATGLFFWTRYRADEAWVRDVLEPIVRELGSMLPALAAGSLQTSTTIRGDRTGITLYRDPATKDTFLVVVHHGSGSVPVTVRLDPALGITRAIADDQEIDVTENTIRAELGPFGARVFRLS